MTNGLTRGGQVLLGLVLVGALAACTTVEGTNAMTDIGTFEREVMTSTAQGLGLVPENEAKEDPTPRAPLALPRDLGNLPPPAQTAAAQLPQNRSAPQIDAAGLSEADLQRLRNARVVDLRATSGRPLTEAEARALTARLTSAGVNVSASGQRPLYIPPDRYFTVVGGETYLCQAANGELVPLTDRRCPADVRRALTSARPDVAGSGEAFSPVGEDWGRRN